MIPFLLVLVLQLPLAPATRSTVHDPEPVCKLPWKDIRIVSSEFTAVRQSLSEYGEQVEGAASDAVFSGLRGSFQTCGSVTIQGVKGRASDTPFDVVIYGLEQDASYWKVKMKVADSEGKPCFATEAKWYLHGSTQPGAEALKAKGMPDGFAEFDETTPKLHIADVHRVAEGKPGPCPCSGVTMGFVHLALSRLFDMKYVDLDDAAKSEECMSVEVAHYAPVMLLAHGHTFWSKPQTLFTVEPRAQELVKIAKDAVVEHPARRYLHEKLKEDICPTAKDKDGNIDEQMRSTKACIWALTRDMNDDPVTWGSIADTFAYSFSTAGKASIKRHGKIDDFCRALNFVNQHIPGSWGDGTFWMETVGLNCYHKTSDTLAYGSE